MEQLLGKTVPTAAKPSIEELDDTWTKSGGTPFYNVHAVSSKDNGLHALYFTTSHPEILLFQPHQSPGYLVISLILHIQPEFWLNSGKL